MKLSSIYLIAASLAAIAGTATAAPADHLREDQRIKGPPARADSLPVVHPGPAKQSAVEHPLKRSGAIHRRADSLPLVGTVIPLDRNVQLGPASLPVLVTPGRSHNLNGQVAEVASTIQRKPIAEGGLPATHGQHVATDAHVLHYYQHDHVKLAAKAASGAKRNYEAAASANGAGWTKLSTHYMKNGQKLDSISRRHKTASFSQRQTDLHKKV